MNIIEAAVKALILLNRPSTVEQICEVITKRRLYQFITSQPIEFVDSEILKACENSKGLQASKEKYFFKYKNLYGLLKWKQIDSDSSTNKEKEISETKNNSINKEQIQNNLNTKEVKKVYNIYEAAIEALTLLDQPSNVTTICSTIINNNLYNFSIARPESYLDLMLNRACDGAKGAPANQEKYFYKLKLNNLYGLLKWKEKDNEKLKVNTIKQDDDLQVVSVLSIESIVPTKTYFVRFPKEAGFYFVVYRDKEVSVLLDYTSEKVIHLPTGDFNNNMLCEKNKIMKFDVYENRKDKGFNCIIDAKHGYENVIAKTVEYFSSDSEYILKSTTSSDNEFYIIFRDSKFTICMDKDNNVRINLTRVFNKTYSDSRYRIYKRVKESGSLKSVTNENKSKLQVAENSSDVAVDIKKVREENIYLKDNLIEVKASTVPQILPFRRYYIDSPNDDKEYFIIYRDDKITVLIQRLSDEIITVQNTDFDKNIMYIKKKKVSFSVFKDIRNSTFSLIDINYTNFSFAKAKDVPKIKWGVEYIVKSNTNPDEIYLVVFRNVKYTVLMDKALNIHKVLTSEFNNGQGELFGKIKDFKVYKNDEHIKKNEISNDSSLNKVMEDKSQEKTIGKDHEYKIEQADRVATKEEFKHIVKENLIEVDNIEIENIEPQNRYIVFCNDKKCLLIYKNENIIVLINDENKTLVITSQEFKNKIFTRNNVQVKISIYKEKVDMLEKETNSIESINTLAEDLFNSLDDLLG